MNGECLAVQTCLVCSMHTKPPHPQPQRLPAFHGSAAWAFFLEAVVSQNKRLVGPKRDINRDSKEVGGIL